jgi:phage baseplate assembly protein W
VPLAEEHYGADLRLLVDLERQSERDRGADLLTQDVEAGVDLQTVAGIGNLEQALLLRFLTHAGELAELGHPTYGSRLPELIGELNTEANRNLAKMYVLQALRDEPRVSEVESVTVTTRSRTRIDIAVRARVIDSDTALNLVFPFFFEGGAPA